MERITNCPLCNTQGPFADYLICKDSLVSGWLFNVQECDKCGFLMTNPRPKLLDINKYYASGDYVSHTDRKKTLQEKLYHVVKRRMTGKKLHIIRKYAKDENISLLDYGCGTGDFVLASEKAGFQAAGHEPDQSAAAKAKEKGVRLLDTKELLAETPPETFNVISLWHVLEHLHDFPGVLESFHRLLAPGGLLFVAAPMANSRDARHYKEYWAAWDVPRHLWHFTPESLERAGANAGLQPIGRHPMPFDSYYISFLSEKKRGKKLMGATILAMVNGSLSNIRAALKKNPWSSEIFVFRK